MENHVQFGNHARKSFNKMKFIDIDKYLFEIKKPNTMRVLLDAGANVNATDKNGKTVLMHAVQNTDSLIFRMFLKAGADVNMKNKQGNTVMMIAINLETSRWRDGRLDKQFKHEMLRYIEQFVRTLLEYNADVNIQNKNGETALMWAVQYRNEEAIKILLEAGADMDIENNYGGTASTWATSTDMVKILENHKTL